MHTVCCSRLQIFIRPAGSRSWDTCTRAWRAVTAQRQGRTCGVETACTAQRASSVRPRHSCGSLEISNDQQLIRRVQAGACTYLGTEEEDGRTMNRSQQTLIPSQYVITGTSLSVLTRSKQTQRSDADLGIHYSGPEMIHSQIGDVPCPYSIQ